MQRLSSKIANYIDNILCGYNHTWNLFSRLNMLYIVPTNVYYGTRVLLKSNKNVRKQRDDNYFLLFCNSTAVIIGLSAIIALKSYMYYILGPLGTARILLAYGKQYETGNQKYVDVINVPMSSATHDGKYILPYIPDDE